jgi:molybdate transport system ATP-binding protein
VILLELDVSHRINNRFDLEVRFSTGPGLTALFGRSGAGKTSVVNMIAGLLRPDRGRIVVDGIVLVDTARGIFVPKHRRRIGYVFQEARLFPHLTVRQNLLFGRWFTARAERREGLEDVVSLLGIAALLERRPGALSGGEKQRVAIGRALLASPRLLLMDEPLASLDAARKDEILPYIERLRDEVRVPIVYVSHSIPEVARLATSIVLMSDGKVDAVGPVETIFGRLDLYPETDRFEAGAVIEAEVVAHDDHFGLTRLLHAAGEITVPRLTVSAGTRVRVRIRARDVIVALERPSAVSALNILRGRVAEVAGGDGPVQDLRIELSEGSVLARVTQRSIVELGLSPGRPVFAIVKSIAVESAATKATPSFTPDGAGGLVDL